MKLNNVLEEVKNDLEEKNYKEVAIGGYGNIRKLFELVPRKFRNLISVDENDDSLWFSYQRLGKVTNIENIKDDSELVESCNKRIRIERINGGDVQIIFKIGKDEEGHWCYNNYEIVVGY
ncbi:hypothetical protein [Clostridium tyrobutyricum]|uniref:hypothetical protein n=1 Tax=Clostridium tyrobutyricum TaxID=1519 RepID=UPI002B204096|nr:hypothetical protein [Clostridium tyrobutyricum]MEA5008755.1 hypothetical protein [Clostridium tyrobutyricum]